MSSMLRSSIRYSQNFLRDPGLVAWLLDTFRLDCGRNVYEIGPGKGIITAQLALRYRYVVAIEKDPRLASLLRHRFADQPNVTIYQGDFLSYRLPHEPYEVVANIPFNRTAAIVAKLTQVGCSPETAYLTMQREASETLIGTPHGSLRAMLTRPWFKMEIVHQFRRTDFAPVPRVDVVMVRLRKRGPPLVRQEDRQPFRDFIVYMFTAWQPSVEQALRRICTRRQLNAFRRGVTFDLELSPSSVTLEQWLQAFKTFQALAGARGMAAIGGSESRLAHQQSHLQKSH